MDISKITDYLYVGTQPGLADYDILRELGIGLIINMRSRHRPSPDSNGNPIKTIWFKTHDNIFLPIPTKILKEGVEAALPLIKNGGKIYVHCGGGRRRSVAMAAAILIAMGKTSKQAMELLKTRRSKADPKAWHIKRKIKKFEKYWLNQNQK